MWLHCGYRGNCGYPGKYSGEFFGSVGVCDVFPPPDGDHSSRNFRESFDWLGLWEHFHFYRFSGSVLADQRLSIRKLLPARVETVGS